MRYDHLIKRPFEIVARRPYLWLLGFLAGAATAFNVPSGGTNYGRPHASDTYQGPSWAVLQNIWDHNAELIVGILAVFVVFCIVMFVLGCIATGGIIHAAVEHDDDHEYTLGKAWRAGYESGWRIAGLRLLTFLLTILPGLFVGTLVLAAVAGAMSSAAPAAVGFGLVAAAALPVSIAFWFLLGLAFQLAQRMIVLEDGRVAESLSSGFRMIFSHFKEVGLGWLILVAVSIGVGIAIAVLGFVVAIPGVAIGFGGWAAGGVTGAIVAGSFAAVFIVGILLVAGAAYSAYSSVYWTLLFRSVRGLPAPSARGAIIPAA
jgi:hypothetical protein